MDDRRAQLIASGLETFSSRPYDAISVEDLAEAAGISKGLLYHYFPGKRDYYVAVLEHAAGRLLADTTPPSRDLPPTLRLRRGLETWLDFVEQHGEAYVALVRGGIGSDPEVAAILEQTRSAFVERILVDLPPVGDTPLLRIALRGWVGFVEGIATEWVRTREVTRDELLALAEDAMVSAVAHASGHRLD
jgi:AcrR family transcriptional regulator